jgi:hypothetical protein
VSCLAFPNASDISLEDSIHQLVLYSFISPALPPTFSDLFYVRSNFATLADLVSVRVVIVASIEPRRRCEMLEMLVYRGKNVMGFQLVGLVPIEGMDAVIVGEGRR